MTARTTKTAAAAPKQAKLTATAKVTGNTVPEAEIVEEDGVFADVMNMYTRAQEALLNFFAVPSWKRTLCAVITYIAGLVGVGMLTSSLVELVMIGAVSAGAPIFLGIVIAALGAILLAWYGHKVVMRVTGAILTKEADEKAAAAYDAVKGMFRRFNPFVKMVPANEQA